MSKTVNEIERTFFRKLSDSANTKINYICIAIETCNQSVKIKGAEIQIK